MAAEVLVVKNIEREGPGLFAKVMDDARIHYQIFGLDSGDAFPSPENFAAVVVLGGPDSANDESNKMRQELAMIKQAVDLEIPYYGACLGMQVLVKACGGGVKKSIPKEIGWRDINDAFFWISLTDEGRKDSLFKGLSSPLRVFHLHGETVSLTDNMKLFQNYLSSNLVSS